MQFEFVHDALVQAAQFSGHFAQVVSLLPALQSVCGGRFAAGAITRSDASVC
jgi:hypothetical protein